MDYQDNPYYNNTIQKRPNAFAVAALICGLIGLPLSCCSGLLGIPFGALGLVFVYLAKRRDQPADPVLTAAMWTSGLALAIGIFMTAYAIYILITDPTILESVNQVYEQLYGESYSEMLQELNGNLTK